MNAGDGTTSVTVICGAFLKKCLELLERGIHATVVSDAFAKAAEKANEVPVPSAPQILHSTEVVGHFYKDPSMKLLNLI